MAFSFVEKGERPTPAGTGVPVRVCLAQAGRLGAGLDGRHGMKALRQVARAFAQRRATVKLHVSWEVRLEGRQELTAAEAATQASARELEGR